MNISKTYTFYLELLSGCSFCPTIQSLANDHGQVLVLSVFTQQLKVYLFTTPALHLFFHSSFPRPGGLGRPAGVQQCGNEALSLYRAETGTRGSLTTAEHRASPGSIPYFGRVYAQIINIQRSESLRVRYQNQSWLMMIMTIYNDDGIFVLAKHQVLVKISPCSQVQ